MKFESILVTIVLFQLAVFNSSYAKSAQAIQKEKIDSIIDYYTSNAISTEKEIPTLIEILNQAEDIDYQEGYLAMLFLILDYYQTISDFKSSSLYIEKCIEILPHINDPEKKGDSYLRISSYYFNITDIQLALDYLHKAKDIYTELDSEKKYLIYGYFAEYAAFKKDFNEAINYYRVPLIHYQTISDSVGLAQMYNNIALPFSQNNQTDSAEFYFNKAIAINKQLKNFNWLGRNYQNLGVLYQSINEFDKSNSFLKLSYQLGDSLNDNEIVAKSLLNRGKNFLSSNQTKPAINLFQKGLEVSNSINLRETKLSTLEFLSASYQELGVFDTALYYHKAYKVLYDSIFNVNTERLLNQMEVKYELERSFREKEIKNRIEKLVLFIIVLLVIIGIYLVYRLYKVQKIKAQRTHAENKMLGTELEKKNREIAKYVINLIQNNEKKLKVIKDMLDKKPLLQKENQQFIDSFINELEEDQFHNVWNEFEIRFGEVHNEFYEKLNIHHPDLTKSERRLCAFLYLDMTTKEISAITMQSQRALEVARTRLRKKLNLTNQSASIPNYLREL